LAACALVVAAACTGENIFPTGVVGGGGGGEGPVVEITMPAEGAAVNVGDSVQVQANITSDNGANQVTLGGVFAGGGTAYVQQVITLNVTLDTTVSRFIRPAGTTTGDAKIIVQAKDVLGNTGSDTVSVTIN
jgi:hypothetical protein